MNRKSSFVRKLVAAGLALLMLAGALPISAAADFSAPSAVDEQSPATPDEPQNPTQPETPDKPSTDINDYPMVSLNDGVKTYQEAKDKPLYISGEGFTSYTVKFMLDNDDLFDSINQDIENDLTDNFSVTLSKDSADSSVKDYCDFKVDKDNKIVTVKINLEDIYSDTVPSGEYTVAVSYNFNDNDEEIGDTSFIIVNEAPKISEITYSVGDLSKWAQDYVTISFEVTGEILKSVKVNGETVTESDGKYSYTATETGEYEIEAVNLLDQSNTEKTGKILIDKEKPVINNLKFYDKNDAPVNGWINEDLTVKLNLSDSDSGIKENSIEVKSVTSDGETTVEHTFADGVLSFVAKERQSYTINCVDNSGRKADEYKIDSDEIKIDRDEPKAEDITIRFETAESFVDSVFNFLTFGLYSNDDINVYVDVDDNELSEIESISLFNGENEIQNTDGKYVLNAPETGSTAFDLYVQATDEAGNGSEKISVINDAVNVKINEGTLQVLPKDFAEIVISKVVPDFDESGIAFDFEQKGTVSDDDNEVVHIAGNGTISLTVKEEITGIFEISATIRRENGNPINYYSESDEFKDSKVEEYKAEFDANDLASGEYTVEFTAVSNSGNKSTILETFVVDNDAPALEDNKFNYSNNLNKDWTNQPVEVAFKLSDVTKIKTVTCSKDGEDVAVTADGASYSFTAETYGEYTVTVVDTLGNSTGYTTEPIKIDLDAPVVKDDAFEFSNAKDGEQSWTNKDVTVKFSIADAPEGENCGLNDKSLEVFADGRALDADKFGLDTKTGKCTFVAEKYGNYSVKLTDSVGNSKTYPVDGEGLEVLVDKTAPAITGVSFALAENTNNDKTLKGKPYGTYANAVIKMTVEVNNATDETAAEGEYSPLADNAVSVSNKNNSSDSTITFDGREGTNNYVFKIAVTENNELTAKDIKDLIMSVTDTAGNKAEYKLGEGAVVVDVNGEGMDEKLYEVIASTATAEIDEIGVTFDQNINGVYSGETGTFDIKVTDELIGLDSIKVEFGKVAYKSSVDINTVELESDVTADIKELEGFASVTESTKVTEKEFKYIADTKQSGRYVFRVTAVNNAGNPIVKAVNVLVDNTAPQISGIEILGNAVVKGANGIYLNNSKDKAIIKVTVTDNIDTVPSAGIGSITISDLGKVDFVQIDENTYSAEFELEADKVYKELKITFTDTFGAEVTNALVDHNLVVGDDTITPDKTNFEIVVLRDENDHTDISKFGYEFDFGAKGSKDAPAIFKDVEKGNISTVVENSVAGIKKIEIAINGETVTYESAETKDYYNKVTKSELTVDAKGYESGEYKIEITVTDNSNVEKIYDEIFYIDKTNPKVTGMEFKPKDASLLDKFFNFVTFGLYSKNDIEVVVSVEDEGPSAGIDKDKIQLTSAKELGIDEGEFAEKVESTYGKKIYTKTFTLKNSDKEETSFYNDLAVSVEDKFENKAAKYNKGQVGDNEFELGDFDIVASGITPEISAITATGNDRYERESDNSLWFSNDPTINFSVKDTVSKLHSVKVELNGTDVTEYCTYNGTNALPKEFTNFANHSGEKISNVSVEFDTSKTELNVNNGKNVIKVTATGNNGVASKTTEFVYYVDKSNPIVVDDKFDYNREWTKDDVTVKFTLDDLSGSGLDTLVVKCDGQELDAEKVKFNASTGECSFVAEQYGEEYTVTITDKVAHEITYPVGEIRIDKTAPSVIGGKFELSNVKDGAQQWSNEITVKFNIEDLPQEHHSGLTDKSLEVFVDGQALAAEQISIDPETGDCSFTVKKYGKYEVKLTDSVGNTKTVNVDTILYDDKTPVISSVNLELAENTSDKTLNKKSYGTYANAVIKMTVEVYDVTTEADWSRLADDAVKIERSDVKFVGREAGTDKYVFNISVTDKLTADDIQEIIMSVEDIAGNKAEYKLKDNAVPVNVNGEGMDKKLYEVIVSAATAQIDDFGVEFKQNKNGVYSGETGKFTTKVTDKLTGLDSIKVEFGKVEYKSDIDINTVKLTDDVTKEALKNFDFDAKKETESSISYTADTKESGRYVFRVTALNNAGNPIVKAVEVLVDNTAPEITKIEILGNAVVKGANGVYLNNTEDDAIIKVTVTDNIDTVPSAGIDSIAISGLNSVDVTDNKDGTYSAQFVLESDKVYTNLNVTVKDVFGFKVTNALVDHNLVVGDDTITPDKTNFEIVVLNNKNVHTTISKFGYEFDFGAKGSKDAPAIFKDVKKGNISTVVENSVAGIKEIEITINGETVTYEAAKTPDKYGKVVKSEITVDAKGYESGEYNIVIKVTDNSDVEKTYDETFYIDKTNPVVTGMEFKPKELSLLDKFFNLITFGLYSRDDIEVVVSVKDEGPSAGIDNKDVKLTSKSGLGIVEGGFTEKVESTYGKKTYTKTFTLKNSDKEETSFYNDLAVSVEDKFENKAAKYNKGQVGNNEFELGDFDIVASGITPEISAITATGNDRYERESDNSLWFSDAPVIRFSVKDTVSKIHSVKVELNGTDVTEYCGFNQPTLSAGVFTDFSQSAKDQGDKISNVSVTLDTSKTEVKDNNGKNVIKVTAIGNNGVASKTAEFVYYVDTTNPYITAIGFSEGQIDGAAGGDPKKNVVRTTYGYYFKNQTVVTVTASDGDDKEKRVGVEYIGFRRVDVDGTEVKYPIQSVDKNNQASFTVPANFKGKIFAYAVDFVKNNKNIEDEFTPENVIVETEAQHKANSDVFINPDIKTSYKDNDNRDLYAGNVPVTIEVKSEYAGIRTVEYTVTAPNDVNNNMASTVTVKNDRSLSIEGKQDTWREVSHDDNLVTKLQTNITVSNNSNNIKVWVKVTDRVGYSTEKEIYFSIDKVDPKIEVEYDVNDPNKVDGQDYYKVDRTATVKVIERNFDEKDFVPHIEGPETKLVAGTNWTSYTPDPTNPDSTVHIAKFTFHSDGDYEFGCSFTDLVGRKAQDYGTDKFTIDQTLPKISVSYDWTAANSYHDKERVATITIEEHNFYAPYVEINQDARQPDNTTPATAPAVSSWTTNGDVSTATIVFEDDGKYSFTVDFKDKALNDAEQVEESEFYIDTKIDKIEIVGVEDMEPYDETVAPVINYFDNNFDIGEYSLKRIDFGKDPEEVTNLIPSISAENGFSKVVTYSDFAKTEENDGIYTLHANIRDKAGNTAETDVLFSVNRFGPTFTILDEETKELVTDKFYTNDAPDIVITEFNVNAVTNPVIQINRDDSTQTLSNGTDYTVKTTGGKSSWHTYDYTILKKNFEDEGNYVVTVTSTDTFDNVVSNRTAYKEVQDGETKIDRTYPVSFVVDKTAPIVTISGIDSDQYYEEAAKSVTVTCDDANITSENLRVEFDGKVLSADEDFELSETAGSVEIRLELEADGNTDDRNFKVSITDKAGNSNEDGVVERFRLSASWLARLLHYHLTLVIIIGVAVALLIGFIIFLIVKRRKKDEEDQ